MKRQFLSVAMCTYNGGPYLIEQLGSIVAQTRLPDEIVVCDDCSSDNTLQILEEFQKKAPFPVRIYRNKINLGPTKNFEKVISLCKGDIIALSDQDDVWLPNKLERLEKVLANHPDAGYAFSDAMVVDEKLHPLGYTMWDRISFTTRQRNLFKQGHQLEVLLKHNVVTGATMIFRAKLRDWILPIPNQWVHDAWIALLASALDVRGIFVEETLIKYRQHHNQVIGGMKVNFREQVQKTISKKEDVQSSDSAKFVVAFSKVVSNGKKYKKAQKLIKDKIKHVRARETLYRSNTFKFVIIILREILSGRYLKFSNGIRSVGKDLIPVIISKKLLRKVLEVNSSQNFK